MARSLPPLPNTMQQHRTTVDGTQPLPQRRKNLPVLLLCRKLKYRSEGILLPGL